MNKEVLKEIIYHKIPKDIKNALVFSLEWLAGAAISNTYPYAIQLYNNESIGLGCIVESSIYEQTKKIVEDPYGVDRVNSVGEVEKVLLGKIFGGIIGIPLQIWGYYELATEVSPWLLGIPVVTNILASTYSKYHNTKTEVKERRLIEPDKYKRNKLKDIK